MTDKEHYFLVTFQICTILNFGKDTSSCGAAADESKWPGNTKFLQPGNHQFDLLNQETRLRDKQASAQVCQRVNSYVIFSWYKANPQNGK